jgi:hypothetical protein
MISLSIHSLLNPRAFYLHWQRAIGHPDLLWRKKKPSVPVKSYEDIYAFAPVM